MTTQELQELIGQKGSVVMYPSWPPSKTGEAIVDVEITHARAIYGRVDVLVTPVAGSGSVWVNADRVKVRGQ